MELHLCCSYDITKMKIQPTQTMNIRWRLYSRLFLATSTCIHYSSTTYSADQIVTRPYFMYTVSDHTVPSWCVFKKHLLTCCPSFRYLKKKNYNNCNMHNYRREMVCVAYLTLYQCLTWLWCNWKLVTTYQGSALWTGCKSWTQCLRSPAEQDYELHLIGGSTYKES
jgi:hypothetical protein